MPQNLLERALTQAPPDKQAHRPYPEIAHAIDAAARDTGGTVTAIGEIDTRGSGTSNIELVGGEGRRRTIPLGAFDHFEEG